MSSDFKICNQSLEEGVAVTIAIGVSNTKLDLAGHSESRGRCEVKAARCQKVYQPVGTEPSSDTERLEPPTEQCRIFQAGMDCKRKEMEQVDSLKRREGLAIAFCLCSFAFNFN